MSTRARGVVGLVVAAGLVAACGGGGSDPVTTSAGGDAEIVETQATDAVPASTSPVTDPPATEPPATDPPVTEPPATDPPESELPEWASGETITIETDTGPLDLPVELVPFCESSRSFYIAGNGLDFVGEEQVGTVQQLLAALATLAPLTVETAPSEEFVAEPTAAQNQLAVIVPALDEIGYDGTRTAELSDPDSLFEALQGFAETLSGLRSFLVQACGADGDVLDDQSRETVQIAAEAVGEAAQPEEPVEPVPGSPVTNVGETITMAVPADWTETDEFVNNGRDTLAVAPDLAAFSDVTAPGVLVLRGEGGFRDGGFVGRVLDFQSDLEEMGCVFLDEIAYDDGVYVGQERLFDCGTDGLEVRLLGGTTADESLYAMAFMVYPSDEPGVRQLIVDTFEVA